MEDSTRASVSSEEKPEFIPGFADVNAYSQTTLQAALQGTKASNAISATEDEASYNRAFDAYRKFMRLEGKQILKLMTLLTRHHGGKVPFENLDDDDILEKLIEVNDSILEETGIALDEASGLRKKQEDIVLTTVRVSKPITTSWNRRSESQHVYELLGGKNVQRPQLKFKDKIDNSKGPFAPIIKEKPNSIKPLAILLEDDGENEPVYTHPYEIEIDKCKPMEEHILAVEPVFPHPLKETPYVFVDTLISLQDLLEELKQTNIFAVDLEHHSYRTFQGITCLMQISTRQCDYLVDVIELRSEMHILNEVFTNPKILKIFHGANNDVQWLQRDFGIYVVNLFDTGQAAAVLQLAHLSLAFLMKHYCQFEPDKQIRLADWRIRPLPSQMVKYAREDTHYLLYIFDRMKKDLIEKGNEQKNLLLSVFQKSKDVCLIRYRKPYSADNNHLTLYINSKKVFNNRQMYALREIYNWRDALARLEDESIGYVLPNHMLLQIAEVLPREQQGILACCNPIPPLVRTQLNEIHSIILNARQSSLQKLDVPELIPVTSSKVENFNEESNLNLSCPHDLPQHDGITKLPTLLSGFNINISNISKFVKTKPTLSIFDSATDKKRKMTTSAYLNVNKLISSFISPFERFKAIKVSACSEIEIAMDHEDARVQRVHEHFKDLASTSQKESETTAKIEIPTTQPNPDDDDDDVEIIERTKRKRKRNKATEELNPPANFKPFDYEAVKNTKKEGLKPDKRAKRKSFNPDQEAEYKGDKGKSWKRRKGQKDQSITYGQNSFHAKKQNWPKR